MKIGSFLDRLVSSRSRKLRRLKKRNQSPRQSAQLELLEQKVLLSAVTVSTTDDVLDGDTSSIANLQATPGADGQISLREAISAANNTAGADSVNVPAGTYVLSLSGSAEDANSTGDLDLLDSAGTTIVGAGAGLTILDGNAQDRIFHVRPGASAAIEGVTIRDGFVDGITSREGAGIQFEGVNLSVIDSRITNNSLPAGNHDGAGINAVGTSVGTINITGSLIDNNVAGDSGGGIDLARQNTTVTINNTTIANNTAGRGAAINGIFSNATTVLTVTNSTITGNANTNSSQAILLATSADWRIGNTIVSGNTGTTADAGVTSLGNNIWGENGASGGGGFSTVATDIVPSGALSTFLDVNPADNGGSTDSYALVESGIAVDAGSNSLATGLVTDQRGVGFDRIVGGTVDIGAFESGAGTAPPVFYPASTYLQASDSPFVGETYSYFHLEDLVDGAMNTPGLTRIGGTISGAGPVGDSVDGDGGCLDGVGHTGNSFYSGFGVQSMTFEFDDASLGDYPTHVGLVYTDIPAIVNFEYFDAAGDSIGTTSFDFTTLGLQQGLTSFDRFMGASFEGGISKLVVTTSGGLSNSGFEVDHIQYGRQDATGTLYNPAPVGACNAAPVISDQTFSLAENSDNGTVAGMAPATDADLPNDTLTWSITGGNINGAFDINSTNGEITVANKAAVDFETTPVFNLTVQVEDSQGETDSATITINLSDEQAFVSIGDASIAEGNTLIFPVTLSQAINIATVVTYSTSDGSATVTDGDYTAETMQTLTIPAGQTAGTISVSTATDSTVESDESLTVNLVGVSAGGDVSVAVASASGTIANDDSSVLSISDASVVETDSGTTQLVFNVSLSSPVSVDVTFDYATVNGTAVAVQDYTAASGTLTIPAGQTASLISVDVSGDTVVELDESLSLDITNLQVSGLDVQREGTTGTFVETDVNSDQNAYGRGYQDIAVADFDGDGDIDAIQVAGSAQDSLGNHPVAILINDGSGTFTQTMIDDPNNPFGIVSAVVLTRVTVGDVDGDGDVDAIVTHGAASTSTNAPSTLFRNNGDATFVTESIANSNFAGDVALGDVDGDGDLDLFVAGQSTTSSGRVLINDGSGVFTDSGQVLNDDAGTSVEMGDIDGDGDVDAVVGTRTGGVVFLNDGSGTFTDSGQSLGSNRNIDLDMADLDGDGDLDLFATSLDGAALVYVNDGSGNFTFSQTVGTVIAGRGFAMDLADVDGDGDLDGFAVTVNTQNRIYVNQGGDQGGTVGQFVESPLFGVSHRGVGMADVDGDGNVDAIMAGTTSAAAGWSVWKNQVITDAPAGTITNDDAATVSIGDATVTEGGNLEFAVTLSQPVDVATVITYSTVDGTATAADSDFTAASAQTITIPAGQTSGTITVATGNDSTVELNEVLGVDISSISAGGRDVTVADGSAIGAIENDDAATITVSDASVNEGNVPGDNSQLVFSVTLDNPVDVDVSFDFATQDITADGSDYTASNGTLTIAAGGTTGQIVIDVEENVTVELDETVQVSLGSLMAGNRNVSLVGTGSTGGGGSPGTFVITLGGAGTSHGQSLGDLDGDGDLDMVVAGRVSGEADQVFFNQGGAQGGTSGVFSHSGQSFQILSTRNPQSYTQIDIGDVDGDGDLDIVAGAAGASSATVIYLNQGGIQGGTEGNFSASAQLLGTAGRAIVLADIDSDGDLDVARSSVNGGLIIDVNQGGTQGGIEGVFVEGQTISNVNFAASILPGDIDGDGDTDLIALEFNNSARVIVNQGGAQGGSVGTMAYNGQPFSVFRGSGGALGDLDGDGDLDVYMSSFAGVNTERIFLNQGAAQGGVPGTFADSGQQFQMNTYRPGTQIGDVDGDGDADVIRGHQLLINQGGTQGGQNGIFVAETAPGQGQSDGHAVEIGDLDGDGDLDFVSSAVGQVNAYINQGDGVANSTVVGTIVNDDLATITIGDATVTEGGNLEFAVTLTQPVDVDTVITYSTVDGTATIADSDFTAATAQTLTIPAGQTSGTITVATTGDNTVEADETLTVNITSIDTGGRDVTVADGTGDATIANDDSSVLSIANAMLVEGDSGTSQLVFNVSLSNPVSVDVSFDYTTVDGSAIAGQDYTATSGTLTIPAGQTAATISVDVPGDNTVELDEAFTLQPGNLQAGGLPVAQSQLGGTLAVIQTASNGNVHGNRQQDIATADLDGDGDLDAFMIAGAANAAQGRLHGSILINDGSGNMTQNYILDPNNPFLIDSSLTTARVALGDVDNDGDVDAVVSHGSNTPGTLFRNDGSGNFTAETITGAGIAGDVDLGDVDGDGDLDAFFTGLSSTGSRVFVNDGAGNFTDSGQSLVDDQGRSVALGDVDGDGDVDALVATDAGGKVFVNDGSGNFSDSGSSLGSTNNIHVSLGDLDGDGDLDAVTSGRDLVDGIYLNDGTGNFSETQTIGSALNFRGSDHILGDFDADGDLDVFRSSVNVGQQMYVNQAGLQQGTEGVFVAEDVLFGSHAGLATGDVDDDGFIDLVAAGNFFPAASGFQVYANQPTVVPASANITNDDSATISIGDATVTEGGNLEFTVTLSQAVDVATVITYSTTDGTATTADGDYTDQTAQTLTIPAGQTSGVITVATTDDEKAESDESLAVTLSALDANGRAVSFDTTTGTGTITNDDFAPAADAGGPYVIFEGDGLTLDASATTDVDSTGLTFRWDIDGDGDYDENVTSASPTLSAAQTASLILNDDGTFNITVEASDGTNVNTALTTLTINNVDPDFEAGLDETLLPPVVGVFSRSLNFTDPGADSWTGTADFGDGSGSQPLTIDQIIKTFDLNHTYTVDGTYTVTVIVQDDDGGAKVDTFEVNVQLNTPPVAVTDDVTVEEDSSIVINVLADNGNGADGDAEGNINAALTVNLTSPTAGSLVNNGDGTFTFNTAGAFESLAAGQTGTVSFQYQIEDSFGETSTATVTITVDGVNDDAVITGDNVGNMDEDAAGDAGVLNVADVDAAEAVFQTQSGTTGTYGDFSIDANGNWTYTRTANLDSMNAGDVLTDSFTVLSADGTATESVTITIDGVNDNATITGDNAGSMTEDDGGDSGVLNVADVDADEAVFQTQSGTTGTYGDFSIDANGNWTYARTANLDSMNAGDVLTDSFTVLSADGTALETVTITIDGVTDNAMISGDNAGDLTEDEAGDSGTLSVSDVDNGEDVFQTQTGTVGDYGNFSIDAGGNWTYTLTADLNSLAPGDSVSDSFSVTSLDGTETEVVEVTINGVNDGPVVTGLTLEAVIDDASKDGSDDRRTAELTSSGDAAVMGQTLILTGTFSDVDSDSHTVTVDWNDGTVETFNIAEVDLNDDGRSFELSHVYETQGAYNVSVTVDDGLATDVDSVGVDVAQTALQSGVLSIAGSQNDDVIKVTRKRGRQIKVKIHQRNIGTESIVVNLADVDEINVLGRGGNDYIAVSHAISLPTVLDGGDGHDVIFGGRGDDKLIGGNGNDILIGRAGDDVILGGAGHDLLKGNEGDDCIDGGSGNDLIAGGSGEDTVSGGSGHDVIWGQNNDDTLFGDDGNDLIFGGNGDDVIHGGNGDDILWGGNGADNIFGGAGNDWINGGAGSDMLIGDDGNDLIFGGSGADLIDGGEGNDVLLGGSGDDIIDGGAGDDLIFGGPGSDTLDGGAGVDLIFQNFNWFWC